MICMYGEFLSVLVLETQVKLPILPTPQNLEIFLKSYIQKEREKKKKRRRKRYDTPGLPIGKEGPVRGLDMYACIICM